jgi:ornithine--oxo-acid transaminase
MIENAARMGAYFQDALRSINSDVISEIRGRGLLIAIELHDEAGTARHYCEALQKRGLLCKETHVKTIRFAPPLIITKDQIDWGMEQIRSVLAA